MFLLSQGTILYAAENGRWQQSWRENNLFRCKAKTFFVMEFLSDLQRPGSMGVKTAVLATLATRVDLAIWETF